MLHKIINKYRGLPIQVKASLWFLVCAFMQRGISVISTPIFTRLLSPSEYGQYSVFNSWLDIVTVFVTLKLTSGVYTQGLVKFDKEAKEYSSSLQGLCLTLVMGWGVIYFLFGDFWNNIFSLTTFQMVAMFVMIWATAVFNFWAVEQRVNLKYQRLVLVTVVVSVAKPLVSAILVLISKDKVTARIFGLAIVEVLSYTSFFFIQMYRGKKFFSRKFWKHALCFNLPLIPHYLSTSVLSSADRIMIGEMVGKREAGIYSLAYSVSLIMTMFNSSLLQTLEPWMYKQIKEKNARSIPKVAYPTFMMIAGVNLILIAFAPEVVGLFAPSEYMDAIWIIPPVAMSVFFMFSYSFFAVFEFYYEKTIYVTVSTMGGAVLNIFLNYVFINLFGYYVAGYTTLVCYIIYACFHYLFMDKICRDCMKENHIYDIRIMLLISIVFMGMGFVFLLTYNYRLLRYALIVVIMLVVFMCKNSIINFMKQLINLKKNKMAKSK